MYEARKCNDLHPLPVSMTLRSHLFSYRTQKLSLSTQMVLGWTRPGRVCSRRIPKKALTFRKCFLLCKKHQNLHHFQKILACSTLSATVFAFFKNHQKFWRFQETKLGLSFYDYMPIENKYYQSILTLE